MSRHKKYNGWNDLAMMKVTEYIIDKTRLHQAQILSEGQLSILNNTEVTIEKTVEGMFIKMTSVLAGKELKGVDYEKTVEVPETWLDAFRLRFCPNLLKDRYPINISEFVVETHWSVTRICPHINRKFDEREHLKFLVHEHSYDDVPMCEG